MIWRQAFRFPLEQASFIPIERRQTTSWRTAEIDYPDSHTKNNIQDRAGDCRR
jgi:hypothetical protein